jgi:asparagine synthase (glutamine-hydrolysing)
MCGIAGIFSVKDSDALREQAGAAADALDHRGTETKKIWSGEGLALAHKRLCIIDTTAAASQPMHYLKRFTIVHNGEIYNYQELKKDLQSKGYSFSTTSDTEVILACYAAYGPHCVQQFDGMFAFAIWDQQEKKLFAARDRFGEKPFFFYNDKDLFAFASEIKGLWAMGIPKDINDALLYNFLTIGYTSNPADPGETFYNGIRNLSPASFLLFDQTTHEMQISKYWLPQIDINKAINDQQAIEQFDSLLRDSVSKRLRSDVSMGTSLSGGLDSSTIVSLCSAFAPEQYSYKAFTAVFDGFEKNEAAFAEKVARQFQLEWIPVRIKDEEVADLMDKVMWHQEMPVSSASAIAQYKVCQSARQNDVTVLLDGQGADETLAGYHKYYKWYWQELYRKRQLSKSGEYEKARDLGIKDRMGWKNQATALFPDFAYAVLQSQKSRRAPKLLPLDPEFAFLNKRQSYYSTPATPDLNGALYFNTFVSGLNELLHLADRNSMAHAREIRLPFLSHKLVEFMFTLPSGFKIRDGWTKWILRKSASPLLPADIVWRKDKIGFEPPQKKWMQQPLVQEAIKNARQKLVDQRILNSSVLNKKVQPQHSHAAENTDWRIWAASYLFK